MNIRQLDFFQKLSALAGGGEPPKSSFQSPADVPRGGRTSAGSLRGVDAELTNTARELLTKAGVPTLATKVEVGWNARMRTAAGVAYTGRGLVLLNPRLRDHGVAEVDRTLRHELAHLLAHFRAGRRRIAPHGVEWQKACSVLDLLNEPRCHNLPFPKLIRARRFRYRCPGCEIEIARTRPLKPSACLSCCRSYSSGRYDERFQFVRI